MSSKTIPQLSDSTRIIRALGRLDPKLRPLIRLHGQPDYRRTKNSFESLVRAIVGQQLSGKAAAAIYARLLHSFSGKLPKPEVLLRVNAGVLRDQGLSSAKARALLDLSAHFADGRLSNRKLGRWDDDIIGERLCEVKGIGPWSVDMFLLFALNRLDVLPVGDLGVRKGMRTYFGLRALPDAAKMTQLATVWRPYRSYATWYMWRVSDSGLPTTLEK